ncbi:unnamed protein product [Euphydryas editha]|uniref:ATP-dependent DNA helicase n=1 Tax=Euphydryas editha TaxID=104508 RepID=A0AAU9UF83_EUPED|nr:unnamed protein product [Euphydryas editha]
MDESLISQYGLPTPTVDEERINREYASEINYNPVELTEILQSGFSNLTEEQRQTYDRVCCSVDNASGEILFLDAPGGTDKTFLTKIILARIRSLNKIALAVASSGIAATLLPGGRTAHTMFKILIDLNSTESPVCNVSRNSDKAKLLRDCALIVWDECTMANQKAVEAVDRTLRGHSRSYIHPDTSRGTRADEITACLKCSTLWRTITSTHLSINMRARLGGVEIKVQRLV